MESKEVRNKQGTLPRAKKRVLDFLCRGWVMEIVGLSTLSIFIQWAGPSMWGPDVVKILVDGFSSAPLTVAMLVLMFAVVAVWFVASVFDLDGGLLPAVEWFIATTRTYTVCIAAVVLVGVSFGNSYPKYKDNLVVAGAVGVVCVVMIWVLGERKKQILQERSEAGKVWCGVVSNCVLAGVAVLSFWGFWDFRGLVVHLK
jgi:hypothetical protein